MTEQLEREPKKVEPARFGEILAWACYDIANAAYATVAATAVYNAYFVSTIAANIPGKAASFATILLTIVICVSSLVIVVSAPILGTICDATGSKKKFLVNRANMSPV
jgi:UMF1 family MFS transporter